MSEWQPIETAPKDGRQVHLGWLPNGELELERWSSWVVDEHYPAGGYWLGKWTPTHWRPAV